MLPFLDLPPEIRQCVLPYLLPNEVRAVGTISRTSAVTALLLACKVIQADLLKLFSTWSPIYRFESPEDIAEVMKGTEVSIISRIKLRIFSKRISSLFTERLRGIMQIMT